MQLNNGQEVTGVKETLLKSRKIYLSESIDEHSAKRVIEDLLAMDTLSQEPISFIINTPGGCVDDGLSIIDTMRGIRSDVNTVVCGTSASMGALISIHGDTRYITENSYWMMHELWGADADYMSKMRGRQKYNQAIQKHVLRLLVAKTKLSKTDMATILNSELWLNAKECLKKGIVDRILR